MTVRAGREFVALAGPTTVPDEVLSAMHCPILDIYSEQMVNLTEDLRRNLSRLFGTGGECYIYASNGVGAWEAALSNVLSSNDRVLILESGRDSIGLSATAASIGCRTELLKANGHRAVRAEEVVARLAQDKSQNIKAIVAVQVDTGSGLLSNIEAIGRAVKAANHPALFIVDTMASLGCIEFSMDRWSVDVAICCSHYGLMTPPGLSFIVANDRARQLHRGAGLRSPYWDWTERDGGTPYRKFGGTAPVHLLFALRQAIDLLLREGLENAHRRHSVIAEAVRDAVTVWANGRVLDFSIADPRARANTITALTMRGRPDLEKLRRFCRDKCGVVLDVGADSLSGPTFCIGHLGHVNAPTILGILSVIEMGCRALGIPVGEGGVGAAVKSLARNVIVDRSHCGVGDPAELSSLKR